MEDGKEKIIANRYKLIERIGVGGMGDIYLASDLQLSRQVAIKTIRNELKDHVEVKKRIDRECNLHATLGVHPNIVALHDRIDRDGNIYLIMEYVRGETLTNRLKEKDERRLALVEIVDLVCQVLDALSHIHANEILHRDIKPSNIMLVEKNGRPIHAKLMDFGIAAIDSDDPAITQITTLVAGGPGTPAYMAPERIDSETFGQSSPATDLYSVGVILYELLGDSPPFQGTMTEVFTGHLAREPNLAKLSEDIPEQLLAVLRKSLEKKQEQRFQDANSFAFALRQSISDISADKIKYEASPSADLDKTVLATGQHLDAIKEAITQSKSAEGGETRKSNKALLIACVVLAAIVLGGAGLYFTRNSKEPVTTPLAPEVTDKVENRQESGETGDHSSGQIARKENGSEDNPKTQPPDLPDPSVSADSKFEPIKQPEDPDKLRSPWDTPSVSISKPEQNYGNAEEVLGKMRSQAKIEKSPQPVKRVAAPPVTKKVSSSSSSQSTKSSGGWIVRESKSRKIQ